MENIRLHGVTPVIAINAFPGDFASEHRAIAEIADELDCRAAVSAHYAEGGKGAAALAEAVVEAAEEPNEFKLLYPDHASLREKIETVATRVYGAAGVEYDLAAARALDRYEERGFGPLPVCIAETHLSISSDPRLRGAPTGWVLPVREVRASVGAGFIYPICGDVRTMPGLGRGADHRHRTGLGEGAQVARRSAWVSHGVPPGGLDAVRAMVYRQNTKCAGER